MKLTIITTAGLAPAGSVGAANFCTQGLNYCSSTLRYLDQDFYLPKLRAAGSNSLVENWLFHCNGGGEISLIEKCIFKFGCVNGGVGQSDRCGVCKPGRWGVCGREAKEDQEDQEE